MNKGFFNLSDGCHANLKNSVLWLPYQLFMQFTTLITPDHFRTNQEVVTEEKCRKCQVFNFEKNDFKVKS